LRVNIRARLNFLDMNLQYRFAFGFVRAINQYLAVEASRPQQIGREFIKNLQNQSESAFI
jgi:hypothetical protein